MGSPIGQFADAMLQSKQAVGKSRLVHTLINAGWHVNAPSSASQNDATEIVESGSTLKSARSDAAEQLRIEQALDQFAVTLPFALDLFQQDAIRTLLAGDSVMVAAPTGSGKTVVAEFGVYYAFRGIGRVFYTTPIKALSNQKYRDLREIYGDRSRTPDRRRLRKSRRSHPRHDDRNPAQHAAADAVGDGRRRCRHLRRDSLPRRPGARHDLGRVDHPLPRACPAHLPLGNRHQRRRDRPVDRPHAPPNSPDHARSAARAACPLLLHRQEAA